jgi:hypothetical protein
MGGRSPNRASAERHFGENHATERRQERCIASCEAWNERLRRGGDPDPSPLLGTALTAGFRWLQIACPDCRSVGEVNLAALDRHPEASLSSLLPALSCRRCPNSRRMPRLVGLSVAPWREPGER